MTKEEALKKIDELKEYNDKAFVVDDLFKRLKEDF